MSEPETPQLRTWVQHSLAAAIHYFADADGVARKFQRELAAHCHIAEITVQRNLKDMITATAVILDEIGSRNGATPCGYRLHEAIAAAFPKLDRHAKARIRRVSSWDLARGEASSRASQNWFLRLVAMHGEACDLDLEELSAACGFLKKKKAYSSQVSNVIRDLEAVRRIRRDRRFDPVTGACIRTVTQLAGESGFIPDHQATAPRPRKQQWPPPDHQRNATRLHAAIRRMAGGLRRPLEAFFGDLAREAFPDKPLKEGKRCVLRALRVLESQQAISVKRQQAEGRKGWRQASIYAALPLRADKQAAHRSPREWCIYRDSLGLPLPPTIAPYGSWTKAYDRGGPQIREVIRTSKSRDKNA